MTSREVLLDANFLIYNLEPKSHLLDGEAKSRLQTLEQAAQQQFEYFLENDTELFVTSLIQYEVLCGARNDHHRHSLQKEIISTCKFLGINKTIAELAAKLYRADCNLKQVDKKKHRFDLLHFATAKHHKLELVTVDRDFASLETAWQECSQTMESPS